MRSIYFFIIVISLKCACCRYSAALMLYFDLYDFEVKALHKTYDAD